MKKELSVVMPCLNEEKTLGNCVEEAFPAVGSAVAFTSMLIMPLLTLGFPLIIYASVKQFNSEKEKIRKILRCIVSWCWGYAVTMVSKFF